MAKNEDPNRYVSIMELENQQDSRFWTKTKQNPFLTGGILAGIGGLIYSAYKFKTRDKSKPLQLYLIHTRVAVQGAVVGALAMGVAWNIFQESFGSKEPEHLFQEQREDPNAKFHRDKHHRDTAAKP